MSVEQQGKIGLETNAKTDTNALLTFLCLAEAAILDYDEIIIAPSPSPLRET